MTKTLNAVKDKKTKEKKVGAWKQIMINELTEHFKERNAFFVSDFIGLESEDINALRRELETLSSHYLVVKNTIARIALQNAGRADLAKMIKGGTGIVLGSGDSAAVAKTLAKFSKTHEFLKLRGGYLDGVVLDAVRINLLATLPSRNELLAKVLGTMKAPIGGFVSVLSNTLGSFVYVVQAIKEKRGG